MSLKRIKFTKNIRFQIWINFVFFMICVLLLLWFFQILFLQKFYENIKTTSTNNAVAEMVEKYRKSDVTTAEDFEKLADEFDMIALDNDFSYMITDSYASKLIHENDHSISYQFSRRQLQELVLNANVSGGITSVQGNVGNSKVLTVCSLLKNKSGTTTGYIVLYSIITPVNTTITMLKQNTSVIMLILVVISLILSLVISNSISKPILKITKASKKLANGEYNVQFDGGSLIETQQLAQSLNYASAEISKIDELQRDLIANVSHDLRTPLTMIKAYAEMIRDLSGERKEKREEHLKIIIDETDRLALLVNDMLDLSKLEKGEQPLNYTTFDINSKLHDIIERYKGISKVMGYKINFTDNTPVLVKCDIVKIEQVIYNLVNNAINYTGDDKQVYITQTIEDDYVKITVTDTGKGISEDNIHQIFDKYYRCEKTKREVIGTGLGLSIVKAILKKHNFPFGVQSKIGIGTSFWFKIKRDNETICTNEK
ncbi:MAG: HAMP domain-containing histidine kinase [Oscillospiraceae bacterium]|nr:HAMP domain-containing histidine kinase [Oscillospiraceae bacterium]